MRITHNEKIEGRIIMEQTKEYYAFISYKREDEKWAKWLQDKLEHYKFPTNLNGRTDLPKSIRPTFRDVTDLNPGLLAEEINNALRNSEWLIVVCSPRSAKSLWVCKEAQTFIDLGRADHIIPFVIEGNPFSNDTVTECYPEALLNLTGSKELLAANINEMGRDAAVVKLVSRMFEVKFDVLWQRYEREQKRKRRLQFLGLSITVLLCLCVAGWIWHQNRILKEKDWHMMENQARYIAEKANELIDKGDSYLARLLLLDVMPKDEYSQDRPLVKEVDSILIKADKYNTALIYTNSYGNHSVAFCNNDTEVVSVLSPEEGTIVKFWDAYSGNCNSSFGITSFSEPKMTLSPDEKRIAIWDLFHDHICIYTLSGKLIQRLKGEHINTVCFNKNGDKLICSSLDGATKICSVNTGNTVFEYRGYASTFSSDGRLVAVAEEKYIAIYDANTGKLIKIISDNVGRVPSMTFSQTDDYIAYTCRDSVIKVTRINADKDVKVLKGHTYRISSIKFSPDGLHLLSASYDFTIKLWNLDQGICERTYSGDNLEVLSACFSNDGKRIASVSSNNIIQIWDVGQEGRFQVLDGHSDIINSVEYGRRGGKLLSVSCDNTLKVWDEKTGMCIKTIDVPSPGARTASFSPNMQYVVAVAAGLSNTVWIFETKTGKCVQKLEGPLNGNADDATKSVIFSSDGERILSCSFFGATRVWDTKTGNVLFSGNEHKNRMGSMPAAFSIDGKRLLQFSRDTTLQYIDIISGNCLWSRADYKSVNQIVHSHSGKYIALSEGRRIAILDSKTGKRIRTLTGNSDMVISISFSYDEKRIVSTSLDWKVRVWDLKTGLCIQVMDGGNCASFSPNGKYIASVRDNNTIFIWELYTMQELRTKTRKRFENRQLTAEERRKYYLE